MMFAGWMVIRVQGCEGGGGVVVVRGPPLALIEGSKYPSLGQRQPSGSDGGRQQQEAASWKLS